MEEKYEKYTYTIGCNVDEALFEKIKEHLEQKGNENIRIVDLHGLTDEDLEGQNVDNFIFENDGDKVNVDIAKKLKSSNEHIAVTAVDYYEKEFLAVQSVFETITDNNIMVIPAPMNVSTEENLQKSVYYFLANVDNVYKQQLLNRYERENNEKQKDNILTEDMELVDVVEVASEVLEVTGYKDEYTKGHVTRVANLSELIAYKSGKSPEEVAMMTLIAKLHDTGKIITPNDILQSKGSLHEDDKEIMKQHATDSGLILNSIFKTRFGDNASPSLKSKLSRLMEGVASHHVDYGKEEQHDELGEILKIADSFDAATSDRGYNLPKTLGDFITDMSYNAGKQFSPEAVEVFVKYLTGKDEVNLEEYAKLYIDRDDSKEVIKEKLALQDKLVPDDIKEEFEAIMHSHFVTSKERLEKYSDRFNPNFRGDIAKFEAAKEYLSENGTQIDSSMLSKEEYNSIHSTSKTEKKKDSSISRLFKKFFSKEKNVKMLNEAPSTAVERTEENEKKFREALSQMTSDVSEKKENVDEKEVRPDIVIDDLHEEK